MRAKLPNAARVCVSARLLSLRSTTLSRVPSTSEPAITATCNLGTQRGDAVSESSTSSRGSAALLFIDFDGVLQTPRLQDFMPFEFVPNLQQVLAPFPEVGLVVSSSHREGMSVDSIRSAFPSSLSEKIVGATPCRAYGRAKAGRYREILEWLAANCHTETPWLALDDEIDLYPENCAQLLRIHPLIGFQAPYDERLTRWLEETAGRRVTISNSELRTANR